MMERGFSETVVLPAGSEATPQRSLRLKRSISRLFLSGSRKSSRSRPPSPSVDDECSPPTVPQLPSAYWPPSPTPNLRSPSPPSKARLLDGKIAYTTGPARVPFPQELQEPTLEPDLSGSGSAWMEPADSLLSTARSSFEEAHRHDLGIARVASIVQIRHVERPIVHHSPTFPPNQERAKTGLRMPNAFASLPRGRGASVTLSASRSQPNLPSPARPSTAGVDAAPNRHTGKRRPDETIDDGNGIAAPAAVTEDASSGPHRPWQAQYSQDEVRSSFRSALTTSSSRVDTTSTGESTRSSVLTKGTSITDSTVEISSRPGSKSGGMTVDDAIDMYAAGFADDNGRDTSLSESRKSTSTDERRKSIPMGEAMSDRAGSERPSHRPSTSGSSGADAIPADRTSSRGSVGPPPIMAPSALRDQYGFLKANRYITGIRYDIWNAGYLSSQIRRTKKWVAFMREQSLPFHHPTRFPQRSAKTQRYVAKGIPAAWRGAAWFYYAGGPAYLALHPDLYADLLVQSDACLSEADKESIERDLHRTFPDNVHFKPNPHASTLDPESPLLSSLRRVLRAFAAHNPKVGYCQSLNFLAGLLLLFLPEEKTFVMLHLITDTLLPGTHEMSLEGANVDLWVLMVALKATQPTIWAKVGFAGTSDPSSSDAHDTAPLSAARLPPISLCTTSWFMSLFIGTLPIESVLRVWDSLFYDGARTLFRTALAIFKLGEKKIQGVSDSMELFQVVQGLPRGMLDANGLMRLVARRGGVAGPWVEARRGQRKLWYAQERARAARRESDVRRGGATLIRAGEKDEEEEEEDDGGEEMAQELRSRRTRAMWRRRRNAGVRA